MDADDRINISLSREEARMMAGDLSRASANVVADVGDEERQGIASDLNAILAVFNVALEEGEGAIEWDLQVSVDGVFKLSPFDLYEEAMEAVGEALRLKKDMPERVVSIVIVERP